MSDTSRFSIERREDDDGVVSWVVVGEIESEEYLAEKALADALGAERGAAMWLVEGGPVAAGRYRVIEDRGHSSSVTEFDVDARMALEVVRVEKAAAPI